MDLNATEICMFGYKRKELCHISTVDSVNHLGVALDRKPLFGDQID